MRHWARVYWQPQLQPSALNLWSATIFCAGVSLERSTPGSSVARTAFLMKIWPVSSKVSTLTLPMQAEKRADLGFVETWIAKAFVFLNDAAFRVEHERSGKSRDAAVLHADFIWGERHGIVDTIFFHDRLDGGRIVIVDNQAENLKAVFVLGLEIDEIVKLCPARSAPGGPEIQKDDLAVRVGECDGLAVEAHELEGGGGIGVAHEADGGLLVLGGRGGRKEAKE